MPSPERAAGPSTALPKGPRELVETTGSPGIWGAVADRFPGLAGELQGESWRVLPRRVGSRGRRRRWQPPSRSRTPGRFWGVRRGRTWTLAGLAVVVAVLGALAAAGTLDSAPLSARGSLGPGRSRSPASAGARPGESPARALEPRPSGSPHSSLPPGALAGASGNLAQASEPPGSSGPSSSAGATPPVATPRAVLQALWTARDQAVVARSLADLQAVESGPALWADLAGLLADQPLGTPPASDLIVLSAGTDPDELSGAVGPARPVPGSTVSLFQASRSAPGAPWRISLLVQAPLPAAQGNGPGTAPPADVLAELASTWQTWGDSGQQPAAGSTPFSLSGALVSVGETLHSQVASAELDGAEASLGLSAVQTPGSQLVLGQTDCGALEETLVLRPGRGPLLQPPSRGPLGPLVPPGTYAEVREQGVLPVCVAGTSSGLTVLAGAGGIWRSQVTPVP